MSRVTCTNCGGAHTPWDCKRPAKKSTGRINPASINKDGSVRKNARYLIDCVCEVCGGKFEAIPNEVKRGKARSCSKSCAAKLSEPQNMEGENNPNWKGGISAGGKSDRYAKKYPEKHAAHRIMTSAIRKKELIRGPCEVCGEAKTDGHHDDYSKPLDVRWLCRKHHIEAHHGRFGATQALPVDTNSQKGRVFAAPLGLASPANAPDAGTANTKDATIQKRPRGRPKSITDMPAYKAAKQREYRAKWKGRG